MTGLFLDVEEYIEDPIEWEVERAIRILRPDEEYDIIPSSMNFPQRREYHTPPRGSRGRFIKEQRHVIDECPAHK